MTPFRLQQPTIVVYHGGCMDGFTAAYVIWQSFPNARFLPASYDKDPVISPEDVANEVVVFVDFTYHPEVMCALAASASQVLILDHHKSAVARFDDMSECHDSGTLTGDIEYRRWLFHNGEDDADYTGELVLGVDLKRSGAMLAWDCFNPGEPAPALIRLVQDRDLWKFEIGGSRQLHAFLSTEDKTFETWQAIDSIAGHNTSLGAMIRDGDTILRAEKAQMESILEQCTRWTTIGGYRVPCCNMPGAWASEAGHRLADMFHDADFVATWYQDSSRAMHVSLRSIGSFDVSQVAMIYGGGGHRNAAGFKTFEQLP
jgi:oligoribonuclease NrnB/cAMP/cGMP phosphodiesterase (DHH superfamily)